MIAVWLSAGCAEPSPNSATVRVLPIASVPAGVCNSAKSDVDQASDIPVARS
jgi:hypothetical protein